MAKVDQNQQFRKPVLQIDALAYTKTKGLIVLSIGKMTLGSFTFELSTYDTPEKIWGLTERIGQVFKETMKEHGKPVSNSLNHQAV